MREVKDIDNEGDGSGIVIEDVDTEMENNDALTMDTQKSKDWPTDRDLLVRRASKSKLNLPTSNISSESDASALLASF